MAKPAGRPAWFKLFLHNKAMLDAIPDENVGKALKAVLHYFDTREVPELDAMAFVVFSSLKPSVDESFEDYARDVENGRKGGRPPKEGKPSVTHPNAGLPIQTEADAEVEADTEGEKRKKKEASTPPPPKATKHKHGEYGNVLLTDEELDKLQAEFPDDWQARINKLSEYIASTGKAYKSHYATLRSWARRDKEEARKPRPGYYIDNPCSHITPEDHENDSENPF